MITDGLGQVLAAGLAIVVLTLFIVVYVMVMAVRSRTGSK
jgi:Na+-transporting methylmalonyl-CoA/oxaloacetate decarboxylase gamma subunit